MKLIDKDALVAKIERRRNQEVQWMEKQGYTEYHQGLRDSYVNILSLINTIEVKEVDLEKEIKEVQRYYKTIDEYEGYFATIYASGIGWIAKHFFELGMQVSNKSQKGE